MINVGKAGRVLISIILGGGTSNDVSQSFHDSSLAQQAFTDVGTSSSIITSGKGSGHLTGNATGSVADLFVGYNYNPLCANFVLGGQLEGTFFSDVSYKLTGIRKSSNTSVAVDSTFGVISSSPSSSTSTEVWEEDLSSMFSLIARAGYLVKPTWLVYVLGGATEGNFVASNFNNNFGGQRNKWELGYTVGGGFEHKFNQNWSVRAEYRFLHIDVDRNQSIASNSSSTQGTSTASFRTTFSSHSSTDFNFNLGLIGIVYQF